MWWVAAHLKSQPPRGVGLRHGAETVERRRPELSGVDKNGGETRGGDVSGKLCLNSDHIRDNSRHNRCPKIMYQTEIQLAASLYRGFKNRRRSNGLLYSTRIKLYNNTYVTSLGSPVRAQRESWREHRESPERALRKPRVFAAFRTSDRGIEGARESPERALREQRECRERALREPRDSPARAERVSRES